MNRRALLRALAIILMACALAMQFGADMNDSARKYTAAGMVSAGFVCVLLSALITRGRAAERSYARADAQKLSSAQSSVRFADVAANDNARKSLMELTDFLKRPEKYKKLGARIPRGVLLFGPPGTGKTLLARALAGEAGVPFLAMNGSDFVEMYVGVGARRVRDVFERARKLGKCVIFIDEIDSLGRARGANSSDERDQTLNALLSEMSGFKPGDGVIVVAATNRAELLDPALTRPGRFDRRIEVGMPGREERRRILEMHSKNKPLASDISLSDIAAKTGFFSGASLENLMNEAAIRAARRDSNNIESEDMRGAYVSIVAGEDGAPIANGEQKSQIALHEAGHAIVLKALLPRNRLSRVSILPSSKGAAGYNLTVPEEKTLPSKRDLEAQICVLLAGRAAETLVFGEQRVTGGAADDLKRAAELAGAMASELGMGADMAVAYGALARATGASASEAMNDARKILDDMFERAAQTLNANFDSLIALSEALMANEALEEADIDAILQNPRAPRANDCAKATA